MEIELDHEWPAINRHLRNSSQLSSVWKLKKPCLNYFLLSTSRCILHVISGSLWLHAGYGVKLKTCLNLRQPDSPFPPNSGLSVGWRNSTPRFASIRERKYSNIKYFISSNRTHNLSHLSPFATPVFYIWMEFIKQGVIKL